VEEAVPALTRFLEDSLAWGGPVDILAVRQLNALGPRAGDALPLLRHALEKRRAAGNAEFKELEALDHAVQVVSGAYKPPGGPANGRPQPSGINGGRITPGVESGSPAKASPEASGGDVVGWVPGFVWAGLILAAAGLLLLLFKKKR
jgi:hypothetical protein